MKRFPRFIFIYLFVVLTLNTYAQLYKGKEFDSAFDGKPIPGGVIYSYNDLYITAIIKGIYDNPVICNSNFPKVKKDPPKLYKYYIQLTVSNAGKYPIRFLGVPTFSVYLKGNTNLNAAKVCTNVGTRPGSISIDLRSIDPNGKIVFDDVSDGGLFKEMPSIAKFKMAHYRILNPNIKKDVWPAVNYRKYEEDQGYASKEANNDEFDDFKNSLEEEMNTIGSANSNSNQTRKNIQNQIGQTASKVATTTTSKKTPSKQMNKNYSNSLCGQLQADADQVYKAVLSFVQRATNSNVKNAFSDTQIVSDKMDRFSNAYVKAIKEDKLSPKCRASISRKTDKYTNQYLNFIKRYTGNILKN